MSQKIPLRDGRVALVDDADFPRVNQHRWFLSGTGYAVGFAPIDGRYELAYMHRFILQATRRQVVDHINGDTLDNRRENLRLATWRQNGQNRRTSPLSATNLKGVGWHKRRQKFHARIQLQGIRYHLGFFEDPELAALAYDAAARLLFGAFARLNYPGRETTPDMQGLVARRLKKRGLNADWYVRRHKKLADLLSGSQESRSPEAVREPVPAATGRGLVGGRPVLGS